MLGVVMAGLRENSSLTKEMLRMVRVFVYDLISDRDSKFLHILAIIQ